MRCTDTSWTQREAIAEKSGKEILLNLYFEVSSMPQVRADQIKI